jgi:osmotically-inducible protein OsmY
MKTVLILGLCLAAAGCERSDPTPTAHAQGVAADNTRKNERDREPAAVTPGDQGNNEVDLDITRKIRQGVVKSDLLSMTAKNVKIITVGGVVTLRGPVKSETERATIATLAGDTAGVKSVNNQLEIAAN